MARPTTDEQQIEEACSMAHLYASKTIEEIDLLLQFIDEIYNRWPQARDYLMSIRENVSLMKRWQTYAQREMRALLDGEQRKRTDTDRLGKLRRRDGDGSF